jgi:hypothetical protein
MTAPLTIPYAKTPVRAFDVRPARPMGDEERSAVDATWLTRELGKVEQALRSPNLYAQSFINLQDIGGDPRDVGDSTRALEKAVREAGGVLPIYVPSGTFRVNTVATTESVRLFGPGTLKHVADPDGPLLDLTNAGTTVLVAEGVTFDGNRAAQSGRPTLLRGSGLRETTLRACTLTGFVTAGLDLAGALGEVTIDATAFTDIAEHGGTTGQTSHAVYLVAVSADHVSMRFNRVVGAVPTLAGGAPGGFFVSVSGEAPCDFLYNQFRRVGQYAASNFSGCIDAYTNGQLMTLTGNRATNSYYVPWKTQIADALIATDNRILGLVDSNAALGMAVLQNVRSYAAELKYAYLGGNYFDLGAGIDLPCIYAAGVDAYHSDGLIVEGNVVKRGGRLALLERIRSATFRDCIADNLIGGGGQNAAILIEDTDQGAGAPAKSVLRVEGGRIGVTNGPILFARTNVLNLDVVVDDVEMTEWGTGNPAVTVYDAASAIVTRNKFREAEPALDLRDLSYAKIDGNDGSSSGTVGVSGTTFVDYGLNPAWDAPGGLVSVSTTYAVPVTAKTILGDATGAAFDVDLPSAAVWDGRILTIKKVDASANAVTVDADGAETIDGAGTYPLTAQWQSITIQSDGTNWYVT